MLVAHPVDGTGSAAGGSISRIRELAPIQRQAPAADTTCEACPQALELGYALVNAAGPTP